MLKWEGPLARFKERLTSGEDVFGQLLDRFLLENKHRVTVVTLPDSELAKQVEAKEAERVITARSQMSADEVLTPSPPPKLSTLRLKYLKNVSTWCRRSRANCGGLLCCCGCACQQASARVQMLRLNNPFASWPSC